jgi:3-hydroxyacyl-[acyl-carrier-protein] dehydratase
MTDAPTLDIVEILKRLPHRYPFLLVDRVLHYESGKSIRALKNVTVNEPFFPGHFPNKPVMPGVLILEAMAQAAGVLSFVSAGTYPDENSKVYFVGIDKARFRRPVVPGDQLIIEVLVGRTLKGIWRVDATAHVGSELACSAELMLLPGSDKGGSSPAAA